MVDEESIAGGRGDVPAANSRRRVVEGQATTRARRREAENRLAALAGAQHGVVAYRQLAQIGFGRGSIRHRVATGRLQPLHRGVYALGHSSITGRARWMAAVLACGPEALASHRTAAAVWALRPTASARVDVSVPRGRSGERHGIDLHHPRRVHPDDRAQKDGIPVTSVPRTLLDLAEVLRPTQLERAFEEAERLRLFDLRAVEELLGRSRGHRGRRPLGALLAREHREPPLVRSELERRFARLCRKADLPTPAANVAVAGYEVDAVWWSQRLVVELDGHRFHGTRAAFERDRVRDAALQLAGFRVLRVTYGRLRDEPSAVMETVRLLLATA